MQWWLAGNIARIQDLSNIVYYIFIICPLRDPLSQPVEPQWNVGVAILYYPCIFLTGLSAMQCSVQSHLFSNWEKSEAVSLEDVGSGVVNHDVRLELSERLFQIPEHTIQPCWVTTTKHSSKSSRQYLITHCYDLLTPVTTSPNYTENNDSKE